jgi:toxin ParE1/3/4
MKSKPVEYHPGARLDAVEAQDWYELHEEGLGRRFQAALAAAEAFVRRNPSLGRPHEFGTRKWPLKTFPYTLIYSEEPAAIVIVAVAHFARDPGYWTGRRAS